MTDKKRTDKMPAEDMKELYSALAADGGEEIPVDEEPIAAVAAVAPERNFVNVYTTRYPYGTSRRSEHIF